MSRANKKSLISDRLSGQPKSHGNLIIHFYFIFSRTGTATLFEFEWLEDGSIAMKASNGNYVTARMNGSLYAVSSAVTDKERFVMRLVNRPILVLKGDHGFVGLKNSKSARVECNKSVYDAIYLEYNEDGTYSFKNASDTNDLVGKYHFIV